MIGCTSFWVYYPSPFRYTPTFLGFFDCRFVLIAEAGFHHRWRGIVLNLPLTPRGHTLRFLSLRRSPGSLLPRRSCSTENGCQSNTEPHSYLATRVAISMCDISCVDRKVKRLGVGNQRRHLRELLQSHMPIQSAPPCDAVHGNSTYLHFQEVDATVLGVTAGR